MANKCFVNLSLGLFLNYLLKRERLSILLLLAFSWLGVIEGGDLMPNSEGYSLRVDDLKAYARKDLNMKQIFRILVIYSK